MSRIENPAPRRIHPKEDPKPLRKKTITAPPPPDYPGEPYVPENPRWIDPPEKEKKKAA